MLMKDASKTKFIKLSLLILFGLVPLGACSLGAPTHITEHRIEIERKTFIQEIDTELITEAFLVDLSRHYQKHGEGPINLMMGYDPRSRNNTAMVTSDQAAEIIDILSKQGVSYVEPSVIPIRDLGDKSRAIFTYTYFEAKAPKECDVMPGYQKNGQIEFDKNYKLGCTIEHAFARQIARPKDLAGSHWKNETSDGRRAANMLDPYRAGIPNETLGGESASGND